jgi:hypothetical protein
VKKLLIIAFLLSFATSSFAAMGIRYNPLDGAWYAPADTLFAIMYGKHFSSSESFTDGNQSRDLTVTQDVAVLRLGFFKDIAGIRTQGSVIFPFGSATADRKVDLSALSPQLVVPLNARFSSTGLADAEINYIIRGAAWGEGGANAGYFDIGGSIFAPIGEYSDNSPVNLGTNRWAFRPLIGMGQNFGPIHLDLFGGADIFMDNDQYTNNAGTLAASKDYTLSQDPELFAEFHATMFLSATNKTYISASFGGVWDGAKTAEKGNSEVKVLGDQETYTARLTIGTSLTKHFSFYTYYAQDLSAVNGNKGNEFGIRLGLIRLPNE